MYTDFSEKVKIHIENIKIYIEKYENKIKCVENTEINESNFTPCIIENYNDITDVYYIIDDFISYGSYQNIYINSVLYDEYLIFLSSIINGLYETRVVINNIFNDITNTILFDSKFDKNKSDYNKFLHFYNLRMSFDLKKLKISMLISYKNIIKYIKKIHTYYIEKILKINNDQSYVM